MKWLLKPANSVSAGVPAEVITVLSLLSLSCWIYLALKASDS